MSEYIIEMLHISKAFRGIQAVADASVCLKRGEIHALLGENGAGKSTLVNILGGMCRMDLGEIRRDGKAVSIRKPIDARALRIGRADAHSTLVGDLTVLDNILLGAEDAAMGFLKRKRARVRALSLSEQYALSVDLDARVEALSPAMRLRAQILRMLYREDEILIFDEATDALTPQEVSAFARMMRRLASEGRTVLLVTRKPDEAIDIADQCTVLRGGRVAGTVDVKTAVRGELMRMATGRCDDLPIEKAETRIGGVVLEVRGATVFDRHRGEDTVYDVSFEVCEGEIVGLMGIPGNGQDELIAALTGLQRMDAGHVRLCGRDITDAPVRLRAAMGMGYIPGDGRGWAAGLSVEDNLLLTRLRQPAFRDGPFLRRGEAREYAERLIAKYNLLHGREDADARDISYCERQMAVVAREIDRGTPLLIAIEPTRGLNTEDAETVIRQLVAVRDAHRAVLLVSHDMGEILALSDRIIVLCEGEIVGEFDPAYTNAAELGLYMAGARRQNRYLRPGEEALL